MPERVIGIDLGTTNSCVAVMDGGAPVVIANRGGYKTTPSVVAVSETGRRLVGHIAKRQAVTNAENTAYAVKRLIGRPWSSPAVQAVKAAVPYELCEGPHQDVRIKIRDQLLSPPEVSAFVLQEMRAIAEEFLGTPVSKAVVTVPAYFNDGQRQSTKDAGRIAGLDVIRIINEPTAAALAYGFGKEVEGVVAIFDLGGGTFDVSLLEIRNGVFEVVATAGDTFLGGEDYDRRLVDWLVQGFAKEHHVDLRSDAMALQRLKDAAEKAKCDLSSLRETEINLPFIMSSGKNQACHVHRVVTRAKLEELTLDLTERTIEICRMTMEDAGLKPRDLAEVVLVGGMTRMPKVQELVADFFDRDPCKGVHPDEAVAMGAAIQGAALVDSAANSDMLLLDVTPHSLGIMVAGGAFHRLIERNTTVPTSKSHVFTTVRDDQTSVKIIVYQGEEDRADQNALLGEFVLSGLRKAQKGDVEIDVTFEISADGIVSVSARDLETGAEQHITVTATSGLTESEIQRMAGKNQELLVAARADEEVEKERQRIEKLVDEAEALMPKVRDALMGTPFGQDSLDNVRLILDDARNAVQRRDASALEQVAEPLMRTLNMFRGVVDSAQIRS